LYFVFERERRERKKKLTLSLPLEKKNFSRESFSWRNTLISESAAWRTFVKEEIHAMGLAL
jgi:nitrate reductase alpha subunit